MISQSLISESEQPTYLLLQQPFLDAAHIDAMKFGAHQASHVGVALIANDLYNHPLNGGAVIDH